jgi:hypothetical protein
VRCDGGFGHVPYVAFCEENNLAFLTRLSHYGLFEREEIKKHLAQALWCRVEDSKSGPLREAADLGEVTLLPAAQTRKEDGTQFDPVKVRVVASRAHTDNDNGAGILIDGKLHELYGTALRPDGWPPEDVVSLYSARADIENGINQAQQLCGVDRILSHHIAGQELLTTVGLFVYNLQTVLGTKIEGLPEEIPAQAERTQSPREQNCETRAEERPTSDDANAASNRPSANAQLRQDATVKAYAEDLRAANQAVEPRAMEPHRSGAIPEETRRAPADPEGLVANPHQAANANDHGCDRDGPKATTQHGAVAEAEAQLGEILDDLDWRRLFDRLGDGWKRPLGAPFLVCPEGFKLRPVRPDHDPNRPHRRRLVLIASRSACGLCPHRASCASPRMERRVRTGIPVNQADRIDSAMRRLRQAKREDAVRPRVQPNNTSEQTNPHTVQKRTERYPGKGFTFPWQPPSGPSARPPLMTQPPLFLAAEARKVAREEFGRIELAVTVVLPLLKTAPRLVAASTSQRQCRRQTWPQRHSYNALPRDARVEVRAAVAKGGSWVAALYLPNRTARAA